MPRCWFVPVIAVAVASAAASEALIGWGAGLVAGASAILWLASRRARVRVEPEPLPSCAPVPDEVVVYEVSSPLHLGAAQRAMAALNHIGHPARAVVLLLQEVDSLDASGLVALESALDDVERHPAVAVLAGVRAQPLAVMHDAELLRRRGVLLCRDRENALRLAARGAVAPQDGFTRPANRPA